MSDVVTLSSLTFSYPPGRSQDTPRTALDNVSFSIRQGEMFCLLGPNGSGKSTLFRLLSTLLVPPADAVTVFGFDLKTHPAEVRQTIGIVFQHSSLDKKLTVRENLLHQGHLYNLRGAPLHARIDEILGRVRLLDRAGDIAEELSGGMQRRVELAKGLLHRPKLLLLDEPSTGLDPGARIEFDAYLKEIQQTEGVTILLTTHILAEAERCDRLAILERGRLVALGTPAALTAEIGADIVTIDADDPAALCAAIREKFGGAPAVIDTKIHVERPGGAEFIPALVGAFPGRIRTVMFSRPTLEDVFIRKTGHQFWSSDEEARA
jgi:ABC-2 type transport system ATP-binding protein